MTFSSLQFCARAISQKRKRSVVFVFLKTTEAFCCRQVPAKPWRHAQRWNLEGHPIWESKPDEDDERFDAESFEETDEEWHEKFYEIYWDEKWTEGAICLCHEGCALRYWLVVTGPQPGQMWWDGCADTSGLMPCENPKGGVMRFTDWYLDWLHKCEEQVSHGAAD